MAQSSGLRRKPEACATAWRPVPFWLGSWTGFGGLRRANSTLARTMDEMLAAAAREGRRAPLILLDGENFEPHGKGVFNWSSHPLNGTLAGPSELYRSAQGVDFYRRATRYCIARWGLSQAVSEFWLTATLNAPGASEFHMSLGAQLSDWTMGLGLDAPAVSLHPAAQPPQTLRVLGNFEPAERRAGWRVDERLGAALGGVMAAPASDGTMCFEARATAPGVTSLGIVDPMAYPTTDWRQAEHDDFSAAGALAFDVWVPPQSPPDLRVGVHLRDRYELWYEALLPAMANPGDWRTYTLDLSALNRNGLKGIGHAKPWNDYSRQRISEIGLHVYSTHPNWSPPGAGSVPLSARFDNIRSIRIFSPQAAPAAAAPVALTLAKADYPSPIVQAREARRKVGPASLPAGDKVAPASLPAGTEAGPTVLSVGEVWECRVAASKVFSNPFDARECDLAALVTTPGGKQVRVPAFFDQPCQRREEKPGGMEIVEPVGAEHFTVRYRVLQAGPHQVSFELREGGKYTPVTAWIADDRFTPAGRAPEARGWGGGGGERFENGRRAVEKIQFVPGPVTATLKLDAPAFTALAEGGTGDRDDSRTGTPARRARPENFRGFVRAAADQRHFQFDDKSFYYPLGPCLRSPSDSRIPYSDAKWSAAEIERIGGRGTYQYDEYFAEFEKAGINWARVWLCSWWGALEWRRDWPGYHGLGRYNLLNAWRIDYLLQRAEEKGIYIDLCLTNHGQFSLRIDAEWRNNPYNARLGGPLASASEFFSRADAKILHQNKLRYLAARYGHSPAVMAWALFSELEWTEEYEASFGFRNWGGPDRPAPNIEAWHTEMAAFLKSVDPNGHLVTTHYSHPTRGEGTLRLPAVEYATSNAYSAFDEWDEGRMDASAALADFWDGNARIKGFKIFGKPALVEEQGRHWGGGRHNTLANLDADLHAGLWGSMVQPLAGATGYWWWLHLHYDKRHGHYKALAEFMKGEDMRPAKDETPLEPAYRVLESPGNVLRGRALKSNRRMYAWVYHERTPYGEPAPEVRGGVMKIGGLDPGVYRIEFWNTYTGVLSESREAEVKPENGTPASIRILLPAVKSDLAVKIKPK